MSAALAVWVISLPDGAQRRAPLVAGLQALGLSPQVFAAVDGRSGLPPHLEAQVDRAAARRIMGRDMSDGELACALSHRGALSAFVQSSAEQCLILEDDAILQDRLADYLAAGGPSRAPMQLLYHSNARVLGPSVPLAPGVIGRRLAVSPFGAVGYVVTKAAAGWLLDQTNPVCRPADWGADLWHVGALAVTPQLIGHPPIVVAQSTLSSAGRSRVAALRWRRFLDLGYYQRVWRKRRATRIS